MFVGIMLLFSCESSPSHAFLLNLCCLVLAEWACHKDREVEEAVEGEKEQGKESPWSQEGELLILFMIAS